MPMTDDKDLLIKIELAVAHKVFDAAALVADYQQQGVDAKKQVLDALYKELREFPQEDLDLIADDLEAVSAVLRAVHSDG